MHSGQKVSKILSQHVLIVGGGMYVRGDQHGYFGTIGPAVLEGVRNGIVKQISIITSSYSTATTAVAALKALSEKMGIHAVSIKALHPTDHIGRVAGEVGCQSAIISIPDHLHAEVSIALAKAGIHILVVKPMADTLDAANRMRRAADESGIIAQIEFHKRLDVSNRYLKSEIARGTIGVPQYGVVHYSQPKRIPEQAFRQWAAKSNIFQYLAVHYVDLLYWATGFLPVRINAWGQKDHLISKGIDTWDSIQAAIVWQRPDDRIFVSTHNTNWIDPNSTTATSDQTLVVVGTKGRICLDQKHRGISVITDETGQRDVNPYFTLNLPDMVETKETFYGYGVESILQFLVDVGRDEMNYYKKEIQKNRPNFTQGIVSTAVIEAVNKSLACGGKTTNVKLSKNFEESDIYKEEFSHEEQL
jgi:predicted dehydrogenase